MPFVANLPAVGMELGVRGVVAVMDLNAAASHFNFSANTFLNFSSLGRTTIWQ